MRAVERLEDGWHAVHGDILEVIENSSSESSAETSLRGIIAESADPEVGLVTRL